MFPKGSKNMYFQDTIGPFRAKLAHAFSLPVKNSDERSTD